MLFFALSFFIDGDRHTYAHRAGGVRFRLCTLCFAHVCLDVWVDGFTTCVSAHTDRTMTELRPHGMDGTDGREEPLPACATAVYSRKHTLHHDIPRTTTPTYVVYAKDICTHTQINTGMPAVPPSVSKHTFFCLKNIPHSVSKAYLFLSQGIPSSVSKACLLLSQKHTFFFSW